MLTRIVLVRSPSGAALWPVRLGGDAQAGDAGVADDVGDLARVGREGDGGGALVDREIEGLARGVIAVVAGEGDGAATQVTEIGASGIDDRHADDDRGAGLP